MPELFGSAAEIDELRRLVRALANQVLCVALLDQRRTALLGAEGLHDREAIGADTVRSSILLARDALRYLDGEARVS
jgi:hypothetical protein